MNMTTDQMYKSSPVYIAFFIYAFALGSLFPRIGDLQIQLGVQEGTLGIALIGLPFGVQISLLLADKILKYLNIRHVATWTPRIHPSPSGVLPPNLRV